jgi:CBS domain containing-hemolysin-like protein
VNGLLNLLPTFIYVGLVFFLSLMCFSLRVGSLKQLERISREQNQLNRLPEILSIRQSALLAFELLLTAALVTGGWWASRQTVLQPLSPPSTFVGIGAVTWVTRMIGTASLVFLMWVAIPRSVARVRGGAVLYACCRMLVLVSQIAAPIWRISQRIDRLIHRTAGLAGPDGRSTQRLTDEILTLVDEGQRHDVIWPGGSRMIHGLLDLHDTDVSSIMTPRINLIAIPAGTNLHDANQLIMKCGYSRFPVIRETIDDISGILYARDLLRCMADGADLKNQTVDSIIRPAVYVPESQRIDTLIDAMQTKKIQLAVVVDEYSGVAGVVTMEDIMEEIVGEISDEFDAESPQLTHQKDGVIEADARAHIDDLNEEFQLELPEGAEYDTLNGFLLTRFGHIPAIGESHQWRNIRLTVLDADDRQLKRVRVERVELPAELAGSD